MIRIAKVLVSVCKGASHHLCQQVIQFCGFRIGTDDLEPIEHRRHLCQADPPGGGWGHRECGPLRLTELDRCSLDRAVIEQVLGGNQPSASLHLDDDMVGNLAIVEAGYTLLDDGLEGARQITLAKQTSLGDRFPSGVEDLCRRLEAAHLRTGRGSGEHPVCPSCHLEPIASQK